MSETTREMTAEEFKNLSKAVLPHLNTLAQIAQDFGLGDSIMSVAVCADGYINFSTHSDTKWSLSRLNKNEKAAIRYEYSEKLEVE